MYEAATEARDRLSRGLPDGNAGLRATVAKVRDDLDSLELAINELSERLEPALLPPVPTPTEVNGKAETRAVSDINEQIQGLGRRIERARASVRYITERVDL